MHLVMVIEACGHFHAGISNIWDLVENTGASLVDQYPITLVHIVGFKIIKNRTNMQILGG